MNEEITIESVVLQQLRAADWIDAHNLLGMLADHGFELKDERALRKQIAAMRDDKTQRDEDRMIVSDGRGYFLLKDSSHADIATKCGLTHMKAALQRLRTAKQYGEWAAKLRATHAKAAQVKLNLEEEAH